MSNDTDDRITKIATIFVECFQALGIELEKQSDLLAQQNELLKELLKEVGR